MKSSMNALTSDTNNYFLIFFSILNWFQIENTSKIWWLFIRKLPFFECVRLETQRMLKCSWPKQNGKGIFWIFSKKIWIS